MAEITRETTLSELLNDPEAQGILAKYNLPCLGCPFAQFEIKTLKLGEVCKMYNINIEKLLKDLNKK